MEILEKVYETIKKYDMAKPGEKLVIGVSGGQDSVVLMDMLYRLSQKLNISLHVAHLNHMFRGEESLGDACFVEKLVNRYNLPATIKHIDVPAFKRISGLSSEAAARKIRYDFFNEVARRVGADKVALAHHADDQAETIIMHFLRGSGLAGLKGMLPVRDNFYIRPLLFVRRKDIEEYLRERNLAYRLDSSNLKTDYFRNKIRLHLLPVLEREYNQSLVFAMTRLGEICREEELYLEGQAIEVYNKIKLKNKTGEIELKLRELCLQPKVLQRRILRQAWYEVTGDYKDLAYEHVEMILDLLKNNQTGGMLVLPKGVRVKRKYESLLFGVNHKNEGIKPYNYEVKLNGKTYIPEINKTLYTEILTVGNFTGKFLQLPQNEACVDFDKVELPLIVRGRMPGDCFIPLGLGGTTKLKKFFINQKVPREERDLIPIVVGGDKIIWVGGMRIAENVKINRGTQKILYLKLK
ncbi:tRNA lysidine(34) synthetase TilS [Desulfolucanica intricata]|uniref:tRNA lysidine(34) synthetase TilS n=1 Tax=Desulfolucanica intricata TaxID=1285191 RepID=UPI000832C5B5|nr:tRNA lysidine(34) synthetase TilS [Desulfolucanica intricata]